MGYQHDHRHCGNQIVPGDGIGRGCPTDCPVKWGEDQQPVLFQGCSGWIYPVSVGSGLSQNNMHPRNQPNFLVAGSYAETGERGCGLVHAIISTFCNYIADFTPESESDALQQATVSRHTPRLMDVRLKTCVIV
jgi:hypothetical protein